MAETPVRTLTIAFIGQVSSGKSSLVNALLSTLASKATMQRSTLRPISYSKAHPVTSETAHIAEEETLLAAIKGNKLTEAQKQSLMTPICRHAPNLNPGITLLDFPGFDDGIDASSKDIFLDVFQKLSHQIDIVIFVSRCEDIFIRNSEYGLYSRTHEIVSNNIIHGRYHELIVAANKFDDDEDDEIKEIIEAARKRLLKNDSLYAVSAHALAKVRLPAYLKFNPKDVWQEREIKKIDKVINARKNTSGTIRLLEDENIFLGLIHINQIDRMFSARSACLIGYIIKTLASEDYNDPLPNIVTILLPLARDQSLALSYANMFIMDIWQNMQFKLCHAYVIMSQFGWNWYEVFRLAPIDALNSILLAHGGRITALEKYIGEPWAIKGTFEVDKNLGKLLPSTVTAGPSIPTDPNSPVRVCNKALAREIIRAIGRKVADTEEINDQLIIDMVPQKAAKAFFMLKTKTYEELVAEMFVDDTPYKTIVTAYIKLTQSKATYVAFKTALARRYFIEGKRGVIHRITDLLYSQ
jgi:GTPase Era involved in 16S rRNA processing